MKLYINMILLMLCASTSFASDGWLTNYEDAKKEAESRGLPILADFSGSDWCKWCVRLDEEVFSQKEFKSFAKENFVLFLADYPRVNKQSKAVIAQNAALQGKYKIRGYPTVLILDEKGNVLHRTGYQAGGAKAYIAHLKKLMSKN